MQRANGRCVSLTLLFTEAVLSSGLLLSGCGGSSKPVVNNGPTPSVSQPGSGGSGSGGSSASPGGSSSGGSGGSGSSSGTGGSAGSGSGSGSGSGGSGNSASSISGAVINAVTGAPITGKVAVALESGFGDPTVVMSTTADAQGHFRFDNVTPAGNAWLIAVSARGADGSLFAVTYLVSGGTPISFGLSGDRITAGTDVGTITMMPSPSGKLSSLIISQNASGTAQDVNVTLDPLRTFTFDRDVAVPWLDAPPQVSTQAGNSGCSGEQVSCARYDATVPTANVWWSAYNHNGNQFKFYDGPNDYSFIYKAFSKSTGAPDCDPPMPDGPGRVKFVNCVP